MRDVVGTVLLLVACSDPEGGEPGPGPSGGSVDAASAGESDAGDSPTPTPGPDAGTPPTTTIDAATPSDAAPPDGCAVAPTGDWSGSLRENLSGGGSSIDVSADITWTLASTAECLDTYTPAGTLVAEAHGLGCTGYDPTTVPISAGDGAMVIDRRTSPATYQITGQNRWQQTAFCDGEQQTLEAVRDWGDQSGTIDGDVFGGGLTFGVTHDVSWRFSRIGVAPPPPEGCAEPPTATWNGVHSIDWADRIVTATVTWSLVSTSGCVDTYQPSGTATLEPGVCSYTPASSAVSSSDGVLEIDRSSNPPTFRAEGSTLWQGTVTCPGYDPYLTTVGGQWGASFGPLDGDDIRGRHDRYNSVSWALTR